VRSASRDPGTACARESNPAEAARGPDSAYLQLLGLPINVGVEHAAGQWAAEKTLVFFLELRTSGNQAISIIAPAGISSSLRFGLS
jgi:hypothetical protein